MKPTKKILKGLAYQIADANTEGLSSSNEIKYSSTGIYFYDGDGNEYLLHMNRENGKITITSTNDSIVIKPRASNQILIETEKI